MAALGPDHHLSLYLNPSTLLPGSGSSQHHPALSESILHPHSYALLVSFQTSSSAGGGHVGTTAAPAPALSNAAQNAAPLASIPNRPW